MVNVLYLEIFSHDVDEGIVSMSCPIESLVMLNVCQYCADSSVIVTFVLVDNGRNKNSVNVQMNNCSNPVTRREDLPWQVDSCKLPVVQNDVTVVCGLCAAARHVCKFSASAREPPEHPDGLLGFRGSCLEAPNEVSVWTKFCEVDMIESAEWIYSNNTDCAVLALQAVKRFENHLGQPLHVHNVFKLLQDKKNESDEKYEVICGAHVGKERNTKTGIQNISSLTVSDVKKKDCKMTKSGTFVDHDTLNNDLKRAHSFSEGPFLTLADIILYPLIFIWINSSSVHEFTRYFPLVSKWYELVGSLQKIRPAKEILLTVTLAKIDKTIFNQVPEVKVESLYKSDSKRSNPKKRLFTKEFDVESALNCVDYKHLLNIKSGSSIAAIDWTKIPSGASPFAGHLPEKRKQRKTQQLENLVAAVLQQAKVGDTIVDFCCGSGHLGILLAHLLPKCTLILLENKEQSLARARVRVSDMGLQNVFFFLCNLDFYNGQFDIGVALHACGVATDLVMEKCVTAKANFVICPCCYGSLHETKRLIYPRSKVFSYIPVSQYMCIGHAADQTHERHSLYERGVRCMQIIDSDRANYAIERSYSVQLSQLKPLTCTPKNMVLIGINVKESANTEESLNN